MESIFETLETDTISIIKQNGETFENIKASVQKNKIFISSPKFVIEKNDKILRKTSIGGEENYLVTNAVFQEAFVTIPTFYNLEVKRVN